MTEEQYRYIAAIYVEMYEKLKAYASAKLETDGQCEEAVQEVFRIACQKPEDLMNSGNPHGWLMKVMKYTAQNMNRKSWNAARLVAEYPVVNGKRVSYTEDTPKLETIFGGTANTEEFRLVKAMAVDGKTHLELAQELGISVAACKKRMERAKKTLKKSLK
ncbi:MAG: sigma-70 family RNA polymerase sigma factor [Oscillospiraceae bacterium]|nr:sigma-70 family RNA polymerase sigma factor [Oscillospiraceae bacterium]